MGFFNPFGGNAGGGTGGTNGKDGKDGFSPTVSVTEINGGHEVNITDKNGSKSFEVLNGSKGDKGDKGDKGNKGDKGDKGETGANGTNGKDGYTPVKGKDYWTESDKNEIVGEAIEEMKETQPTFVEITESDILEKVGLYDEELEGLSMVISDNETRIDKTWSSSKIYGEVDKVASGITLLGDKISNLTLGLHTDGLFYIFIDNKPIGNGISLPKASGDVYGNVDSGNNIVLNGDLADGEYFIKYEMADGSTIDIGELVLDTTEPEPVYTNFFVVNGDGYIETGRCSSAGENRTDATTSFVTNYIDVEYGDTVYIKGYQTPTSTNPYCGVKYTDGTTGGFMLETDTTTIKDFSLADGVAQFAINATNADYVRFTIKKPNSLDEIIINIKRNGEWL